MEAAQPGGVCVAGVVALVDWIGIGKRDDGVWCVCGGGGVGRGAGVFALVDWIGTEG